MGLKIFWKLRAVRYIVYWKMRTLLYLVRLWLRNFFYVYLFKYQSFRIVRSWVVSANNRIFKIKIRLIHGLKGREYSLVSASSFVNSNNVDAIVLEPRSYLRVRGPKFIGNYNFRPFGNPTVDLVMPKLEIITLNNSVVMGGTDFFFINGVTVHPDEYDIERDVCPAELNGITKIDTERKFISVTPGRDVNIEKAISLLGSCTGNYAHWLTETLPKLLLIDLISEFDNYPLLVDNWIHPNFIRSIELLSKNERELIRIRRWGAVRVGFLANVSPPSYTPPEYRYFLETKKLEIPRSGDFLFSKTALNMLRDRAHEAIKPILLEGPQKIYLYRSRESCGNTRHVTNIEEIESIIRDYDYVMLDPAKLDFKDQIVIFSMARKIISPLGAALANTVFTRPGCDVIGLSPYYENANYYYFSNFMGVLGHNLYYVLGVQKSRRGHPLHRGYEIDLDSFRCALDFLNSR